MGTQDRQPSADAPESQSGRGRRQAWADGIPVPDDLHVPPHDGGHDRLPAEDVLQHILAVVGPERIAHATVAWAISLEPCDIGDGEGIARDLGLEHVVDHTRSGQGATVWSGVYLGVEVQVKAALRSTTRSAQ